MKLFIKKTMVLIGLMVFVFLPPCSAESAGSVFLQNNNHCHSGDEVKLAKPADGMREVTMEELKHRKSPEEKILNGEKDRVNPADDTIK